MILSSLFSGDWRSFLINLLLSLPIILFALSFHEMAHGYIANKLGDPTAKNLGRLTLNPAKHLDPIGTICMLVFGFGWAKPVPVMARNFKNPKRGMAYTAMAGPISNLILGIISSVIYPFIRYGYIQVAMTHGGDAFITTVMLFISTFFQLSALYNFMLMAFNLIPVPPFDGSRIINLFLPEHLYFKMMKYERTIMFAVLLGVMLISRFWFSPFSWIAEKLFELIASPIFNILLG